MRLPIAPSVGGCLSVPVCPSAHLCRLSLTHPRREAQQLGPHVRGQRLQALPVEAVRERGLRLGKAPEQIGRRGGAERLEVFRGDVKLTLWVFRFSEQGGTRQGGGEGVDNLTLGGI